METLIFESNRKKKKRNIRVKHDRHNFALLRTCRQIHAEATTISYHHIVLDLDDCEIRAGMESEELSSHHSFSSIQSLRVTSVSLPWAGAPKRGSRRTEISRYMQDAQVLMRMQKSIWKFVKTMMPSLVNLWVEIVLTTNMENLRHLSMDAEWMQPVIALNWLEFLGFRALSDGAEVRGSRSFEALMRDMMCKGGMNKKSEPKYLCSRTPEETLTEALQRKDAKLP